MLQNYIMSMRKLKLLFFIVIALHFVRCNDKESKDVYQDSRDNIIYLSNLVKEVKMDDITISAVSMMYVGSKYLFIIDFKSLDYLVSVFDKKTFRYINSIIPRGQGPGEIANPGRITIDDKNDRLFLIDHGKSKIFSYRIDSVVRNPDFMPDIVSLMDNKDFPVESYYLNDTLSLSLIMQPTGNSGFNAYIAKWNMNTGEITPMNYSNSRVSPKRVALAVSSEKKIYVEGYNHYDLLTLCDFDGNLIKNVYGPNWEENPKESIRHFGGLSFYGDYLIASYSGNPSKSEKRFPTKFLVFDLQGNYVNTFQIGYDILDFCCDYDNKRILMKLNDDKQFAFLELDDLLK